MWPNSWAIWDHGIIEQEKGGKITDAWIYLELGGHSTGPGHNKYKVSKELEDTSL